MSKIVYDEAKAMSLRYHHVFIQNEKNCLQSNHNEAVSKFILQLYEGKAGNAASLF